MFCYLRTVRSWPLHSDCRFWICPQGIAPAPVRRAACLRSTPPRISLHCNLDVFERQAYIRFFSDFMCAVQRQAKALTPPTRSGGTSRAKGTGSNRVAMLIGESARPRLRPLTASTTEQSHCSASDVLTQFTNSNTMRPPAPSVRLRAVRPQSHRTSSTNCDDPIQ